jgi:hypothetical protein
MPIVEVSVGELLDKWSILEIKKFKLIKDSQQANILREMNALRETCYKYLEHDEILSAYELLYKVNLRIWDGMDELYELDTNLSQHYINLTNEITELNKERAYLKKKIDKASNSDFSEEKSYF